MPEGSTVLIIDSDPVSTEALGKALRVSGAQLYFAKDTADGIRLIDTCAADAVVVDCALDGVKLLEHARSVQTQRHFPVLAIGPGASEEAHMRFLRAGADAFLPRPVSAAEVNAWVQRQLGLRWRIDALMAENARLRELSLTDGLTLVANHRSFEERLKDEFRRAQRYDDPLSLILIDLDHFKNINDAHGHQMGDEVLRSVAQSIVRAVRETDFVARYGGEEFAVILPKTPLAGSLTVAERIFSEMSGLHLGPTGGIRVTASLGVSGFPNRAVVSAEQLLRTSDDALYRAKREGRNKIALFQPAWPAASAARPSSPGGRGVG